MHTLEELKDIQRMVLTYENIALQDSEQAALLMGEKLMPYKKTNAVVAAVPRGGVPIGFHLAQLLQLPFEIIPCKKIRHPGHSYESIGSVSMDDAVVRETESRIPQDYIYHQIILLQNSLKSRYKFYKGDLKTVSFKDKTVILVDDVLYSGDSMLAGIKSILKQEPSKIIVAVSVATPDALSQIEEQADEILNLLTIADAHTVSDFYSKFPRVEDEEIRNFIEYLEAHKSKRI